MTLPRAPRPSPPVLRRGHGGLLVLLLSLGALAPPSLLLDPAPAAAQDGNEKGKGKGKEKGKGKGGEDGRAGEKDGEEDRKKSEEEKLLEALGKQWKAGDHGGLGARLPAKTRVALRLPGMTGGEYRREQALSLLKGYFEDRSFRKVALKSVKEEVGTFEVEYVRVSDRKKVAAELVLTLGTEKGKRVLVGARESP